MISYKKLIPFLPLESGTWNAMKQNLFVDAAITTRWSVTDTHHLSPRLQSAPSVEILPRSLKSPSHCRCYLCRPLTSSLCYQTLKKSTCNISCTGQQNSFHLLLLPWTSGSNTPFQCHITTMPSGIAWLRSGHLIEPTWLKACRTPVLIACSVLSSNTTTEPYPRFFP